MATRNDSQQVPKTLVRRYKSSWPPSLFNWQPRNGEFHEVFFLIHSLWGSSIKISEVATLATLGNLHNLHKLKMAANHNMEFFHLALFLK